jgi:hypothetical protein
MDAWMNGMVNNGTKIDDAHNDSVDLDLPFWILQ